MELGDLTVALFPAFCRLQYMAVHGESLETRLPLEYIWPPSTFRNQGKTQTRSSLVPKPPTFLQQKRGRSGLIQIDRYSFFLYAKHLSVSLEIPLKILGVMGVPSGRSRAHLAVSTEWVLFQTSKGVVV